MRKKGLITLVFIAVTIAITAGCAKSYKTIPDREIEEIFKEMFLSNAYVASQKTIDYNQLDSMDFYRPILERYGYEIGDLKYTLANFTKKKSSRISDVLEQVILQLEREKDQREYVVMVRDSIRARLYRRYTEIIYEDSLITAKKIADTAKLKLTIATPREGKYKIDYYYKVDTLDKNKEIKTQFSVLGRDKKVTQYQSYWMIGRMSKQKQDIELIITKDDEQIEIVFGSYKKDKLATPNLEIRDLIIKFHLNEKDALYRLEEEIFDYKLIIDGKKYEWVQPPKKNSRTLYIYPNRVEQAEDSGGGSDGDDSSAGELS